MGLGFRYQETSTGTAWWWAVRVVGRGRLSRLVAGEGGPSTYDGQSRWFLFRFRGPFLCADPGGTLQALCEGTSLSWSGGGKGVSIKGWSNLGRTGGHLAPFNEDPKAQRTDPPHQEGVLGGAKGVLGQTEE